MFPGAKFLENLMFSIAAIEFSIVIAPPPVCELKASGLVAVPFVIVNPLSVTFEEAPIAINLAKMQTIEGQFWWSGTKKSHEI